MLQQQQVCKYAIILYIASHGICQQLRTANTAVAVFKKTEKKTLLKLWQVPLDAAAKG